VKGKVDQQLLMFVCFLKKKTSNQGKKKRKESMKQGRKYKGDCTFQFQIHQKHIFKPLIKFTKIKFQNIYIIGGYKKSIRFYAKNPRPNKPKYQITWVNRTYKFILTIYTKIENKDLVWDNFLRFYELMTSRGELEAYVFETYLNLVDFVWSWGYYKKHKGIPLVGKDYIICPFNYKLGPGGVSSK
jgi:hypothetical protein